MRHPRGYALLMAAAITVSASYGCGSGGSSEGLAAAARAGPVTAFAEDSPDATGPGAAGHTKKGPDGPAGQAGPGYTMTELFERFHRGRNATDYPGSGLGLALVRATMDLHGGAVEVESGPGGSRFRLVLPG